ncbi:MAG: hypothetical protein QNJ97_14055 [Myxococcota bacterium]|nr:hypothetical protein [Myxococcota bacterium]
MRGLLSLSTMGIVALLASGCIISDSDADRCGPGLCFKDNACWPDTSEVCVPEGDTSDIDAGASDSGVPDTDSGSSDTDSDTGDTQPTGLGEPCTGPEHGDCAGYDADYCASDPFNNYVGICTIKDCTTDPDNCPNGWRCCYFIEMANRPNLCLMSDVYQEQVEAGICIE